MHRPTIGTIALVLLAAAAALWVWQDQIHQGEAWLSACLRVGSVMAALWLAHPQLSRWPAWLVAGGAGVLLVTLLFRQPRVLLVALGVLFIVLRLRPASAKPQHREPAVRR
jgi:hypothetical protein